MDDETQKIITEQMKKLPKDVVEAIVSVDYKKKLQEITVKQKLLIDSAGKLEMETTLVMIGLEPLADYVGNLQREMGLSVVRAKEIALDVSENIFKPIRESLKKMNETVENEEGAEEATAEPVISAEVNLNRDQILNEIENPVPNRPVSTGIEVRPPQELETLPGEEVRNIPSLVETKMSGITITPRQIVNAKPEIKLPEVKKKPYGGTDPYREEIK